jgi:hypothetical protein
MPSWSSPAFIAIAIPAIGKSACEKALGPFPARFYTERTTIRSKSGYVGRSLGQDQFYFDFGYFPSGVNKELGKIQVLLTRWLFACDILRRFLRRVSLAKPPSAPLQF